VIGPPADEQRHGRSLIGGVWWFLIGHLLRAAAQTVYRQVVMHGSQRGVPARRIMSSEPVWTRASVRSRSPVVESQRQIGFVSQFFSCARLTRDTTGSEGLQARVAPRERRCIAWLYDRWWCEGRPKRANGSSILPAPSDERHGNGKSILRAFIPGGGSTAPAPGSPSLATECYGAGSTAERRRASV
jgi:hypothetical protein